MLRSTEEKGLILPLFAMMIFAIMAVIGLAVDGGHLHHSRLALQKAADAAAIAAAKNYALTPYKSRGGAFRDQTKLHAREVLLANLESNTNGFDESKVTIRVTSVDFREETVELEASWNVRLYILGHFPGYSEELPVKVKAKSQARKAMVGLLFDTSFRLLCPSDSTDCTCGMGFPAICPNPRITHVLNAAKEFVTNLNEARDMIDIAWFSNSARPDLGMWLDGGFDPAEVRDHLDSISNNDQLHAASNTSDGLLRSHLSTKQATVWQHRSNVARVMFTDTGAPGAGRFFFSNPTALPKNNKIDAANPRVDYDYYSIASDWITAKQYFGKDIDQGWISGVSDLIKATVPYNWTFASAYPPTEENPGGGSAGCGIQNVEAPDDRVPFYGCLADFGFYMPDSKAGEIYGQWVDRSLYRLQYYHVAIAMSDYLRRMGSIIYGVNLGKDPPVMTDAYQDYMNTTTRKDCFVSRLTNDPEPYNIYCRNVDFPPPFGRANAGGGTTNHMSEGKYVFADQVIKLRPLYVEMYQRISRKLKTGVLVETP